MQIFRVCPFWGQTNFQKHQKKVRNGVELHQEQILQNTKLEIELLSLWETPDSSFEMITIYSNSNYRFELRNFYFRNQNPHKIFQTQAKNRHYTIMVLNFRTISHLSLRKIVSPLSFPLLHGRESRVCFSICPTKNDNQ